MVFLLVWWEQSKLSRNTSFGLGCVCCRMVSKFIQAWFLFLKFLNYNIYSRSWLHFKVFFYTNNSVSSFVDLILFIVLHSRFQIETPRIFVSFRWQKYELFQFILIVLMYQQLFQWYCKKKRDLDRVIEKTKKSYIIEFILKIDIRRKQLCRSGVHATSPSWADGKESCLSNKYWMLFVITNPL